MVINLVDMINSHNEDNIKLALIILNNCDRSNVITANNVASMVTKCNNLFFTLWKENDNIKISFYYNDGKMYIEEDEINITWEPYVP